MTTFWHPGWTVEKNAFANLVVTALKPTFRGKSAARRYKLARERIDQAFERYRSAPDAPPLGCRSFDCFGCCLHQDEVGTTDFEVERILNRVQRERRLNDVVTRAEALVAKKTGGACPLLSQDGRCTVYDIRPLECASYHSLDREACHSGATAQIRYAPMLRIELTLISGFGMVPVADMDRRSPLPKKDLFDELARRGRARLGQRKAA